MDTVDIVRVLGTILCLVGIVLAFRVGRRRFTGLSADEHISLGNASVSQAALWKMLADLRVQPAGRREANVLIEPHARLRDGR